MNTPMTTRQAALYLGYSEHVLRQSRHRKKLKGLTPPRVTMLGDKPHYIREDLDNWLALRDGKLPNSAPNVDIADLPHYVHELLMIVKRNPTSGFTITNKEIVITYKSL